MLFAYRCTAKDDTFRCVPITADAVLRLGCCNCCISERLVRDTPSSGWLLCTMTLLLVAEVWCDVDDGWPDSSIIYHLQGKGDRSYREQTKLMKFKQKP